MNLPLLLAGPVWRTVKRYWWAIPLLALSLWAWRVDSLRAGYKADLSNVRTEYAAFQKEVVAKATEALAAQKAVNAAQEQKWKDQARYAGQNHEAALDAALDRANRFIADNRLLREEIDRGASGGTGSASDSGSPGSVDGAGGASELVAVSAADVRICTVNTQRIIDARDWALGLNTP